MIFRYLLSLAILTMTASQSLAHELAQPPAGVAVIFDRETIRPVIVEGLADREALRGVEPNDPVRIASISKLIMALTVLRVAGDDVAMLNADVSDYLGWKLRNPAYPDTPVTLAQLLMHRSGLRDANGYVIPLGESLRAKMDDPASWYADAKPGEAPFEYANLGSPVVATVLEAATGVRYDKLVQREVFEPLEIEACLNWIGCSDDQVESAVILYRDTGEVARDDAADLPPNCTFPVADGVACDLSDYVPGTNASIFSPQGGVRIGMMDLARIGQELMKTSEDSFLSFHVLGEFIFSMMHKPENQDFFCVYGMGIQMIEAPQETCDDHLFNDGVTRIGHAGEAYGLRSGLWLDGKSGKGVAYFITAVPPRQSAEDEGGFDAREIEFVRRAMAIKSDASETLPESVQEFEKQD